MTPSPPRPIDALVLLQRDHFETADLFAAFALSSQDRAKQQLATRICRALTIHALCEDEFLYPAAYRMMDRDLIYAAEIEHASAIELIDAITASSPADDAFNATVKVLGDQVRHHVAEEEAELVPRLRQSGLDLIALGYAIAERKQGLEAKPHRSELCRPPPAAARLVAAK